MSDIVINSPAAKLWEILATMIVAQSAHWGVQLEEGHDSRAEELLKLIDFGQAFVDTDQVKTGNVFDRVFRWLEDTKKDEPYPATLARELGIQEHLGTMRLRFPNPDVFGTPLHKHAIVVAPFGLRRDLEIPLQVWRHITRMLRSYGRPVLLLGDLDSRLDIATYTEGDLLGRQPVSTIMATLAAAEVVVGVPNEWTWLTGSLGKTMTLLYPDDAARLRWFWMGGKSTVRILFTGSNVQTPIILSSIRNVFRELL